MRRPTILLVDDHALVLDAFKKLLEPEFEVVGTVSDSREAVSFATVLKPDVIVLDLGMPEIDGLHAGPELKKRLPRTKLIVLTMNEDSDVASEALRGRTYVTPMTERQLQEKFIRCPEIGQSKTLTVRQREVLKLLAEGRTMRETADILHVTPRTIAFHKYKIMEEFGLKTNSDLVKLALREKVY